MALSGTMVLLIAVHPAQPLALDDHQLELMPASFSLSVTWWKGIRDVAESGRSSIQVDADLYRFVLKKANFADGGTYIVKASNCHGTQKAYCTVRVRRRMRFHATFVTLAARCFFSTFLFIILRFASLDRRQ